MSWQEAAGPDSSATSLASPPGYPDLGHATVGFNHGLPRRACRVTLPAQGGGNNPRVSGGAALDLATHRYFRAWRARVDLDQTLSIIVIAIFACLTSLVGVRRRSEARDRAFLRFSRGFRRLFAIVATPTQLGGEYPDPGGSPLIPPDWPAGRSPAGGPFPSGGRNPRFAGWEIPGFPARSSRRITGPTGPVRSVRYPPTRGMRGNPPRTAQSGPPRSPGAYLP
jgi:hypothetical protein